MSATLTPERKSARDRPGVGHKVGDWGLLFGGEKEGDIGASTGELGAGRRRVTLAEITSTRERARPAVA